MTLGGPSLLLWYRGRKRLPRRVTMHRVPNLRKPLCHDLPPWSRNLSHFEDLLLLDRFSLDYSLHQSCLGRYLTQHQICQQSTQYQVLWLFSPGSKALTTFPNIKSKRWPRYWHQRIFYLYLQIVQIWYLFYFQVLRLACQLHPQRHCTESSSEFLHLIAVKKRSRPVYAQVAASPSGCNTLWSSA